MLVFVLQIHIPTQLFRVLELLLKKRFTTVFGTVIDIYSTSCLVMPTWGSYGGLVSKQTNTTPFIYSALNLLHTINLCSNLHCVLSFNTKIVDITFAPFTIIIGY